MDDLDKVIDGLNRFSLLAQLRDKVVYARAAGDRVCGSCHFWMKSRECPREHNVNGMTCGPSCGELACGKFQMTISAQQVQADRIRDAADFATRHDLPMPITRSLG